MTLHATTQHQPAARGAVAWAASRRGPAVAARLGALNSKAPAALSSAGAGIEP